MTDTPRDPRDDFPDDPTEQSEDGFGTWLQDLEAAADEDTLFTLLARQRPPSGKLARQQIRGRVKAKLEQKFEQFGSHSSAARTVDAWLREGGGETLALQGEDFRPEEIVPFESEVAASDLLKEVRDIFDAYLHAKGEYLDALALWTTYTHAFDSFGVSPLLDLSSPTKRCGKSTAVVVVRHLAPAPLLSGNISASSMFRAVSAWKPTLLIDEADTFAKMNDELRGILNAGHTRATAYVIRSEGDSNEPRVFHTWAPKVVAAIGRLPDTIEDRSIRIVLLRKPVEIEKKDAFDDEQVRADCQVVRRKLARFALDHLESISTARPVRPSGLHDRGWNNWKPLFAIAMVAGDDWFERAKKAALATGGSDGDDNDTEEDVSTLALQHVHEALLDSVDGNLGTADILTLLIARDDGPWAKWWEASLNRGETKGPSARLARLLKPFGLKSKQLWIAGTNVRGFSLEDFDATLLAAYLGNNARDASHARPGFPPQAGSSDPSDPSVISGVPREAWCDDHARLVEVVRVEDGWIFFSCGCIADAVSRAGQ